MPPGEAQLVAARFEATGPALRGGGCDVFRAIDRSTGETVALKVLREGGAISAGRLEREGQILRAVQHPGLPRYHWHGVDEQGRACLVVEWIEGPTLAERLKDSAMQVADTVTLARRLASILALLHERGLVHRDVKPGNILLENGDVARARLVDLGIARAPGYGRELTVAGEPLGTPAYMAPEQARGRLDVDARADVFGLGAVLFRCLVGRAPFVAESLTATLARVLFERPSRVASMVPGVPAWLDELVDLLLAKEKSARPADGAAVLRLLETHGGEGAPPSSMPSSVRSGPPPALGPGEHRVVAVVVASTSVDPVAADDATRSMVAPGGGADADATARAEVVCAAHGAHMEVLASGVLVAALDREGDADERAAAAARCAFALRDALGSPAVALATGLGLVDDGALLGEAIDKAVALLFARERWTAGRGVAPWPKAVLVDDTTAGLLSGRFAIRPAPEGAWLAASAASEASSRGSVTPFVGRGRERRLLDDELSECVRRPGARAVLVLGAPGIGKSRLAREFVASLGPDVTVWRGKSDWIGAQGSLDLVGDTLRSAFGAAPGEDPKVARGRLSRRLATHLSRDDAERVGAFLGELLGLPPGEGREVAVQLRAARQDPMLMADQVRRAFEDLLRAECSRSTVVIVLDDLQRGDAASVKLIESALRALRSRPLLVLGLARAELRERHPQVLAWRGATTMELGELAQDDCRKLASVLLPRADDRALERVVTSSAGNAFFLEELARALARRPGAACDGGGGAADDELQAPDTVLSMIRAQLERASPLARRVLRAASVYGSTFSLPALLPLLGGRAAAPDGEVRDALEELAECDLIAMTERGFQDGSTAWAFRHDLVREAAVGTLTDADERLGHRLAGAYLAGLPRPNPSAVAEHFLRGDQPKRAIEWLASAAEHALEGNDLDGAIAAAGRGVELGAAGALLGRARLTLAEAHRWQGDHVAAHREARDALALLDQGTVAYARAAGELGTACGKLARREELADLTAMLLTMLPVLATQETPASPGPPGPAEATLGRRQLGGARVVAACRAVTQLFYLGGKEAGVPALARLREVPPELLAGEPLARARLSGAESVLAMFERRPDAQLALVRRARDFFVEAGSYRDATLFELSIGHAAIELGRYQDAALVLRAARVTARDLGLPYLLPMASLNLGLALVHLPDAESRAEAEALEREVVSETDPQRDVRVHCAARTYLAIALMASGRVAEAEVEGRAAVALTAGARTLAAAAHAVLAEALLALGRPSEALEIARAAQPASSGSEEGEAHVRLVLAEALAATGDTESARRAVERARDLVLEQAARIEDEMLRKSFVEQVPEHRRTLELAASLAAS